jgi:hypothetical protein
MKAVTIFEKEKNMKKYKVRWINGIIEDNVWINDGAFYTWTDVAEIIKEY